MARAAVPPSRGLSWRIFQQRSGSTLLALLLILIRGHC